MSTGKYHNFSASPVKAENQASPVRTSMFSLAESPDKKRSPAKLQLNKVPWKSDDSSKYKESSGQLSSGRGRSSGHGKSSGRKSKIEGQFEMGMAVAAQRISIGGFITNFAIKKENSLRTQKLNSSYHSRRSYNKSDLSEHGKFQAVNQSNRLEIPKNSQRLSVGSESSIEPGSGRISALPFRGNVNVQGGTSLPVKPR